MTKVTTSWSRGALQTLGHSPQLGLRAGDGERGGDILGIKMIWGFDLGVGHSCFRSSSTKCQQA